MTPLDPFSEKKSRSFLSLLQEMGRSQVRMHSSLGTASPIVVFPIDGFTSHSGSLRKRVN
jgi:hypothetical protein